MASQINDKSPSNAHFAQASGGAQPETGSRTVNGLNVLDCDTFRYMVNTDQAATVFPIKTEINVAILAARDVANSEDIVFYANSNPTPGVTTSDNTWDGYGNGNQDYLEASYGYDDFNERCRVNFQDSPDWVAETAGNDSALPPAVPIQVSNLTRGSSGGNLFLWVNSDQTDNRSLAAENNNVATTLVLGGHGSLGSISRRLNGAIGEVVVWHGAITNSDRYKIEGYLAHKWGITSNLPAGHPYKSNQPLV